MQYLNLKQQAILRSTVNSNKIMKNQFQVQKYQPIKNWFNLHQPDAHSNQERLCATLARPVVEFNFNRATPAPRTAFFHDEIDDFQHGFCVGGVNYIPKSLRNG